MSLLSVFGTTGDVPVCAHVLACTERHHLISPDLSFVDLELVVLLCEQASELRILVDRPIQPSSRAEKTLERSLAYRSARFADLLVNAGHLHQDQVWDFQRTHGFSGETQSYNTRYRHRFKIDTDKPRFLHIFAESHEPVAEIVAIRLINDPRVHGAGTFQQNREDWQVNVPYLLRIGFFTRLPKPTFVARHFVRRHAIRLLSCDSEADRCLTQHQLLPAARMSHLWLKMSIRDGLKPLIEEISKNPTARAEEIANALGSTLDYAHTDVWLVAPNIWILGRTPGSRPSPELSGNPHWILFDSTKGISNFYLYHWVPGTSESYTDGMPFLLLRVKDDIEILLSPWWLDRRRLFPVLVGATGVGLGVYNLSRGSLDASTSIAIVLALVSLVLVLGLYLSIEWLARRFKLM